MKDFVHPTIPVPPTRSLPLPRQPIIPKPTLGFAINDLDYLLPLFYTRAVKHIPWRAYCLRVLGFSFQLRPRQPGEGSSLLISNLNSSSHYKGGAMTRRHSALRGMRLTRAINNAATEDRGRREGGKEGGPVV